MTETKQARRPHPSQSTAEHFWMCCCCCCWPGCTSAAVTPHEASLGQTLNFHGEMLGRLQEK